MSPAEIMAAVVFGLAVFGAITGAFWRVWGLIAEAGNEGREAKEELAAHKLHSAETFATKVGLTEALGRVHDALDRLTDRIDTLITQSAPKPRSRS